MTAVETRNDRDDAAADMQVAMADKEATAAPDQPDVVKDISDRVCRLLECPVCLSLATRMACLCANGHMVCTSCLMLLNRRTPAPGCPMCRSPIVCNAYTSAASSGLSLITSAMKVACPHRGYGCAELFRLDQVTFHESECAYMPTARCLSFMCQWVGANGQLYEHVRRFHRHASVVKTSVNVNARFSAVIIY
ncbi:E3 ubiquitin-protein ligase sina-like [Sipha flava]|jgi:hypothetical protein|uniref:E3 ubiquitin-protein ligase n=1 Tax=Sipha flava TaxID=143950 RepID=A0A2S2QW45_9HEMI|nr:E3 ubiquitin-protein ligase sina-like [Sipha flava]